MKKIASLILVVSMLTMFLAGCDGKTPSNGDSTRRNNDQVSLKPNSGATTIRLAATLPDTHQLTKSARVFADYVNENSNGELNVEIYPAGQLYNDTTMVDAIPEGYIEMGLCQTANWSSYVPSAEFFSLAGYFNDYDWFKRCCAGEPGRYVIKQIEDSMGVKVLSLFNYGVAELCSTKSLESPKDFKGLKLRMAGISEAEYCKALGGAPVSFSASENYEALSKGTVDGVDTGPSSVISRKLFEVAHYVTINTMLKETKYFLMVNGKFWNGLSDANKNLLQKAADVAFEYNKTASAESDRAAIKQLDDMPDVTVTYWTKEQQDSIREVVLPPVLSNFKKMVGEETYNRLIDAAEALR